MNEKVTLGTVLTGIQREKYLQQRLSFTKRTNLYCKNTVKFCTNVSQC